MGNQGGHIILPVFVVLFLRFPEGNARAFPGVRPGVAAGLPRRQAFGRSGFFRQRSEQYFTSSQTFAHFLRQSKGRPQAAQVFCGRFPFLIIFAMAYRSRLNWFVLGMARLRGLRSLTKRGFARLA